MVVVVVKNDKTLCNVLGKNAFCRVTLLTHENATTTKKEKLLT